MRERFSAVSSFSLRRTSFFASLNGLMKPMLVILPRLRIIAVIGMRWSKCIPKSNFIKPLGRHRFARQVELGNEFHDFVLARSALCLLERFNELRQCANRAILRNAIFTAHLALNFAFAERVRASEHPAEDRIVLRSKSPCDEPSRC